MLHLRFHVHGVVETSGVHECVFPNLEAAREFARLSARFMMSERLRTEGRLNLGHRIDIEDANGRMLDSIRFGDVVEIEGLPALLAVD